MTQELSDDRWRRVRERLAAVRTPENEGIVDRIAGHLDAGELSPIVAEGLLESADRMTQRGLEEALRLSGDMARYHDDAGIRALRELSDDGPDAYRGRPEDAPPLVRRSKPSRERT
jgi:hypothetical protein